MKLSNAVAEYIAHKQATGRRYTAQIIILRDFSRSMGNVEVNEVPPALAREFLETSGAAAGYRYQLHHTIRQLYRYLIAHGHATGSPVPAVAPKRGPEFAPYIYSHDELRQLLDATASYFRSKSTTTLQGGTFRTLLLLLYGAGLRISEALALTVGDVDLTSGLLTVRESKFYKTRLVPLGGCLGL